MVCDTALNAGQVCSVSEGPCTVCLQCPVRPLSFTGYQALYTLHQIGTPCEPSSARPYQPGHNVVGAAVV